MTSENDDLIVRDKCCRLCLDRQREFDRQHTPLVAGDIVLFNTIDAAAAFVATKNKDVAVFEDDRRCRAPALVEVGNTLPSIHAYRVPLARLKHTVDAPAADCVNKVSLMGQGVSVPALIELSLFDADFRFGVVHVDISCHIGEL